MDAGWCRAWAQVQPAAFAQRAARLAALAIERCAGRPGERCRSSLRRAGVQPGRAGSCMEQARCVVRALPDKLLAVTRDVGEVLDSLILCGRAQPCRQG